MLRPTRARARAPRRAARHAARSTSAARTCAATASPGSSSCATRATSTPRTTPRCAATEAAVDLVLLDPEIEVGVFRGGVVDHPRYAGRRIFGAGINLTHLYRGRVPFLFYFVRDLGYVNKLYRGLSAPEWQPGELQDSTEKLWIAAAETYAIGGACQLLHVMDHVIAERGCRLYLPARKEGIIPGASNLRLPRAVGDRIARQAILSGREFEAGTPDGDLLCDEVVEPGEMDAAIERARRAADELGPGQRRRQPAHDARRPEPLDVFRSLHGDVRARAGLLPLQPGADRQPRAPLGCTQPPSLTSSARRASSCARCSSSACARLVARLLDAVPPTRERLHAAGVRSARGRRQPRRPARGCRSSIKADLREHYPFGLLAVPREELVRVHASSGTGGKPTVVGYTRARPRHVDRGDGALPGDGRRAARDARPQRLRLRAVHRRARLPPGRRAAGRDGRARCPAASPSARSRCCATCGAQVLFATPSYALHIGAGAGATHGIGPDDLALEVGVFGAEPWTEAMRAAIERALGLTAVQHLRAVGDRRARRRGRVPRGARRARTSRRTTSSPRSSTPRPASRCPTAPRASWSSPR